ncbi:MAG TPA: hypothetical protein VF855_07485 [Acidimicrobiales bacterium]
MSALVRSELLKLRSVRSIVVLWLLAVALGIGFSLLGPLAVPSDQIEEVGDNFGLAMAGLGICQVLLGVVGILAITQEQRFHTLRLTFAVEPRRLRALVAKVAAVAIVCLAATVVVVPLALAGGMAVLEAKGFSVDLGDPGVARALVWSVLNGVLFGVIGYGIGAVLRSAAGAITTFVVWQLVVESALVALLPDIGKWAPFQSATTVQRPTFAEESLGVLSAALVWLGCTIALAVAGTILVIRRDA